MSTDDWSKWLREQPARWTAVAESTTKKLTSLLNEHLPTSAKSITLPTTTFTDLPVSETIAAATAAVAKLPAIPRTLDEARSLGRSDPVTFAVYSSLAVVGLVGASVTLPRGVWRYKNAGDLQNKIFDRKVKLRGTVTNVTDGDGFRLYHRPWVYRVLGRKAPTERKDLKEETIPIRIAAVDAPESAHFGMPAQPFANEAKAFLKKLVEGREVTVQMLLRDRYNRAVAMVFVRRFLFFKKNVSLEMVKKGFAAIYVGDGAQYADMLDVFKKEEEKARRKKLGMWTKSGGKHVTPMEHKKEHLRGGL